MIIFPAAKLVYFAVPRVGSTTFESAFSRNNPDAVVLPENKKHTNVRQFENNWRKKPHEWFAQDMERMAILRDPLERLHSWFRYRRRLDESHPNSTKSVDFETFIHMTMQHDPQPWAKSVGNQWNFCRRKDGKLGISHLFDIDNQAPLDEFLQDHLGRRFPQSRQNESRAAEMVLSKATERKLRKVRAKEFDFYETVRESGGHLVTGI